MGRKIMLAVALVALVAAPAFAAVQNVKVGGDLKTTSVIRKNFEAGSLQGAQKKSQNVILSQVGINIEADLTDNVSTFIRLGNERLWGTADNSSGNDNVNMDQAYVTMKEFLYAPLTVTLGRQPLVYGNALIIGDSGHYNEVTSVPDLTGGASFDALKAVLDFDPLTVDLFAAKVSEGSATALNDDDDKDLYGINSNWKLGGDMNVVLESYLFAEMSKTGIPATQDKPNKLYVPGLRASLNPYEGLNLQLEGAYQFGNAATTTGDSKDIQAYAVQAMASFALPVMEDISPVLSGSYTLLSGGDSSDSKVRDWQAMYEDQNTGRIFDAISGTNSNMKIASLALEVKPMEDVTTKLSWYNLSRIQKSPNNGSKYANEVDLDVTYAYTEDVTFGLSAGILNGKALSGSSVGQGQDNVASQLLSSVKVVF